MSYLHRIIVFIKFLLLSSFKLLKIKADVVIATSTPLTIGIPALLKRLINGTPYIFEVRDVWPETVIAIGAIKNRFIVKLLYFLEKTIYKNAAFIVPLSVDMKKSIVIRYPNLSDKIPNVIENISEVNRFSKGSMVSLSEVIGFEPRFSILYAGTFGKVNNIMYVIDIARQLLTFDSSIVFLLIGEGVEKDTVIKYAEKSNVLNKNVFIKPSISKDELSSYYNLVDMGSSFVAPINELFANSANKFFDTLAARKPILINHSGWQKKVIENKNIGYVLPERLDDFNPIEFVSYTKDKQLHIVQSKNSYKLAKNEFSLDVAVEKYIKIINKVVVN